MRHLKELVEIVAENRVKNSDLLNNISAPEQRKDPYVKFFQAIRKGHLMDDEQASHFFFKEPPGNKYRKFKFLFINKLLNTLSHINPERPGISEYGKAELWCSQTRHNINTLSFFSGRITADELCLKMLAKSQKYQLSEYIIFSAFTLLEHKAFSGGRDEYKLYDKIYEEWIGTHNAELQAKKFLRDIKIRYAKTIALKPEIAKLAFDYATSVKKDIDKKSTFILNTYYYRLLAFGFQISLQYEKSLDVWKEMESYLEANEIFKSNTLLAEIALYKMGAYMYLKQYKDGLKCAAKCIKLFRPGISTRLVFMEYYFLMAMQSKKYNEALDIYITSTKDPRMDMMPEVNQEKWKIYKGYVYYATYKLKKEIDISFNLKRFLNDVTEFQHDKAGFNASALIIYICILIREHDFVKAIDKLEALKQYNSKYLRKSHSKRTGIFVQMLLKTYKYDFNSKVIKEKTINQVNELKSVEYAHTMNMEGLEVIPYETLWEMILNDLK